MNQMRLIDADALKVRIMEDAPDFLDGGSSITKAFILAMLGTRSVTPTIDAVPVVLCKDCIYGDDFDCPAPLPTGYLCQKGHGSHTGDWFCADGKRRIDDA